MTVKSDSPKYQPQEIEQKWQAIWEKEGVYKPDLDKARKPFYNLMMFPYPSAEGMHVGNMYAFTGADVYGRFQRMQGNDVFEPIGLDGFGIHSENYAIKVGKHPVEQAKASEKNFYRQLRSIGNGFDWTRTVETYKPEYYKWTQWIFIQLFKAGLAYRKKAPVNFCPSCKTVLADEQVLEGLCERCNSVVEKRDLEQWFFKITKYADRLLSNLSQIDWAEKVKIAQRQWIGKSEGALIEFSLNFKKNPKDNDRRDPDGKAAHISVFTTRPDTLFGATFLVLSPEHPLVASVLNGEFEAPRPGLAKLKSYVEEAKKKTEQERGEGKEKTGVFTGLYAINPVNKEKIPVWVADYVLMGYGTGAIMAVPAHDQRDFEFAKKFKLPVKEVIVRQPRVSDDAQLHNPGSQSSSSASLSKIRHQTIPRPNFSSSESGLSHSAYIGEGEIVNSGEWNGWKTPDSIGRVIDWFEKKDLGKKEANYHLRDWLISRQRYWGPPIPMIYCNDCDWQPVPEKDLPVELPFIEDYKPLGTGVAPLASHPEFYKTKCPNCGKDAKRETDVSDTFLDSAWYFLRYVSTDVETSAFDREKVRKWLPVDMYIGGAEHSVLHLLYSRFMTMVLHDLGFISFDEPFTSFRAHGLIVKDGAKMSKSKGNVVVPDAYVKKFGADTLRTYLMFMGPYSQGGDFRDSGIEGMHRFLRRVWTLFQCHPELVSGSPANRQATLQSEEMLKQVQHDKESLQMMHKTIKKVTEDISNLSYNTAIASLMEWYNFLSDKQKETRDKISKEEVETFLKLIAPFAPHLSEELYFMINADRDQQMPADNRWQSIHLSAWPKYDPKYLEVSERVVVIQVNGKLRGNMKVKSEKLKVKSYIEALAKEDNKAARYLEGKQIKKVIYIEGKVINFVVS